MGCHWNRGRGLGNEQTFYHPPSYDQLRTGPAEAVAAAALRAGGLAGGWTWLGEEKKANGIVAWDSIIITSSEQLI